MAPKRSLSSLEIDLNNDLAKRPHLESKFCGKCYKLKIHTFINVITLELQLGYLTDAKQDYVEPIIRRIGLHFDSSNFATCISCQLLREALFHGFWVSSRYDVNFTTVRRYVRTQILVDSPIDALGEIWVQSLHHGRAETETTHHNVLGESIDYARLRAILAYCVRDDVLCKPVFDPVLRSIHLIDVDARTLVKYPSKVSCEYVALSYVWGSAHAPEFKISQLSDLPPVVDDAVVVVQALGLKYLWVDAVCIDQADDEYKKSQVNIMDWIYGGAFATIVALTGKSAFCPLPRVRSHYDLIPHKMDGNLDVDSEEYYAILFGLENGIERSVWATRGWTFQEAMLSRRCLLFCEEEIYFWCNEYQARESSRLDGPIARSVERRRSVMRGILSDTPGTLDNPFLEIENYFTSDPSIHQKYRFFSTILRKYFPRRFSNEADVINAYAGVLHQFQLSLFETGFHFGLPRTDFRISMGWYYDGPPVQRRLQHPSWSWAGWMLEKQVSFPETSSIQQQPYLEVHDLKGEPLRPASHNEIGDNCEFEEFFSGLNEKMAQTALQNKKSIERGFSESCITVHGILLSIAVSASPVPPEGLNGAMQCHLDTPEGSSLHRHFAMTLFFDEGSEEHSKLVEAPEKNAVVHSFLLLSVTRSSTTLVALNLIMLVWVDGVAYRRCLVIVTLTPERCNLLYECAPRLEKFLLD